MWWIIGVFWPRRPQFYARSCKECHAFASKYVKWQAHLRRVDPQFATMREVDLLPHLHSSAAALGPKAEWITGTHHVCGSTST